MTPKRPQTPKAFWRGTHRTSTPENTIKRFGRFAGAFGITRLATVTGLDYLGIPVVMAVRPNSRSLSVSQGKGLDEASAEASAFMEAAELAHAERLRMPTRVESYAALRIRARAADPMRLPRLKGASAVHTAKLPWVEGVNLADRFPIFVPFDLVDADFRRAREGRHPLFFRSSNGLASGNHWLEAVCAGICEVIERDAASLWRGWTPQQRAARRLVLASVLDSDCRALLDRLADRAMTVAVWDITTDVGAACFICRIADGPRSGRAPLGVFWGAGCHLNREVALARAITEAAQSRLTYIAGSRDDLSPGDYDKPRPQTLFDHLSDHWEERQARHGFKDVPSNASPTFEGDVARLLTLLGKAGCDQVIAVDLTDDRYGIPVVRIIVPGLEPHDEHERHEPGRRARATAKPTP